ncbi:hypothetical protein SNE40_004146 [Patella caerulea]|uniref:Uncharacterized protein n=1 Tax=Patella caerulea TaxID=87958 RepID=A0AAN8Q9F6_PATCE
MSANKADCVIDIPDSDEDETAVLKMDEMAPDSDVSQSGTGKVHLEESNTDKNHQETSFERLPNESTKLKSATSLTTNSISSFNTATQQTHSLTTSEIFPCQSSQDEFSLKKEKLTSPTQPLEGVAITSHSTSHKIQELQVLETIKNRTPESYRKNGLNRQELKLILTHHPRMEKNFEGFLFLEKLVDSLQDGTIEEGYYLVSNENLKKRGELLHCTFLMAVNHKGQRNYLYFDPHGKAPDNLGLVNTDPKNNTCGRVVWKSSKLSGNNKYDTVFWWNVSVLQKPNNNTCVFIFLLFYDKLTRHRRSVEFPPIVDLREDSIDFFRNQILPAVRIGDI